MINHNHNCWKRINNSSYFYKSCYGIIIKKKISKFGFANFINILSSQKYFDFLSDLSCIQKIFIACAHSVISIIKLKLSGSGLSNLYH